MPKAAHQNLTIISALSVRSIASVRTLFEEYFAALADDMGKAIGCGDMHADMAEFPANHRALFLAKLNGNPIAACGLKHVSGKDIELVRLYCQPKARGLGVGAKLVQTCTEFAQVHNYQRLVLSTEPIMKAAVKLYENLGFEPIQSYSPKPSACSTYMGLKL